MDNRIGGIILAGGMSRRFGSPKAFAKLDGIPFYEYIINAMKPVTDSIVIVTNDKLIERFQVNAPTIEIITDNPTISGYGPLAGIYSGMDYLAFDWYLISPIDIPYIEVSVYQTLLQHISYNTEAIIPIVNGRIQPLVSIFHRSIMDKIAAQLNRKELSLKQLLSKCKVDYIEMNNEKAFQNINYREDLQIDSVKDITDS
ncbi:molybdenum cofactor guanylyltransferase [Ornithinibacillus scapharcae]|uniref:molybdenum cofactor guanylyltransferase n=1 Tax=Ornithinibacillus scapharcae TaxID=1147159 RepID=UPI000225B6C2|nr:molybdenum cofactor guanylyltransferase [Ornithinibacillus scapharcae]